MLKKGFPVGMQPGDFIDIDAGGTGATTADGARKKLSVKEVLQRNRNYFVSATSGSDSNDGLDTGPSAFRTIQKAIDVVTDIDSGDYKITIIVEGGKTYSNFTLKKPTGKYPPLITPADELIPDIRVEATNGYPCIYGKDAGHWEIAGIGYDQKMAMTDTCVAEGDTRITLRGEHDVLSSRLENFVALDGGKIFVAGNVTFSYRSDHRSLFYAQGTGSYIQVGLPTYNIVALIPERAIIIDPPFKAMEGGVINLMNSIWPNYYEYSGPTYVASRGSHIYYQGDREKLPGYGEGYADSTSSFNDPLPDDNGREIIKAATYNCYIRPDGNDNNTGEADTPAGAWKTTAGALRNLLKKDLQESNIVCRLSAGEYTGLKIPDDYPWNVLFMGWSFTSVIFTHTSSAAIVAVGKNSRVRLSSIHLKGDNDLAGRPRQLAGIQAGPGSVAELSGCAYTGTKTAILAERGGVVIYNNTPYLYPGVTEAHFTARSGGVIYAHASSVRSMGASTYSKAFAVAEGNGSIESTSTYPTQYGKRYLAKNGGSIVAMGGNVNTFPGNVAGTTENGGSFGID